MPTSLFQYEMLPTTWFYLSSLMIVAVFFRFNRVFSVRNLDILTLIFLTPGLIYVAMGSAPQGYLWLAAIGAFGFSRLVFDSLLRRRPMLEPNLNVAGLTFACVAASAFIVPNLWLNRGDFLESPRAWRLEQILTAADANDENAVKVEERPGFRPFLRAAEKTNRFFAPSDEAWIRAASSSATETTNAESVLYFFGTAIRVDAAQKRSDDGEKASRAMRAMRWAAGRGGENEFASVDASNDEGDENAPATEFSGAPVAPVAPVAPSVLGTGVEQAPAAPTSAPVPEPIPTPPMRDVYRLTPSGDASGGRDAATFDGETGADGAGVRTPSFEQTALILSVGALQIGVVVLIILIGRFHLGSTQTGLSAALLYLLLPYVNQFSACLDHIVPALAILTAVLFYRRPVVSGFALGAAGALAFYPFFLLPLWFGFYWKRGAARFALGTSAAVLTFAVVLLATTSATDDYGSALAAMLGRRSLFLASADGLWEYWPRFYRIPLISLFGVFCVGYALWPPRKDLATLISGSAALMLGVQIWMGYRGGLYMAWYLPLAALTVFRPNLFDRVATTTVVDV
ncbi:MAG: hypothetical protein IJE77_04325 [Thermoguttaceae bacterium]|nr:hypothetical protein [Thermoguttaceae bacterium]MBQ9798334.1 hypothetical protein [Thermoguttaceae bacterium]